jgi:hypothetical protein
MGGGLAGGQLLSGFEGKGLICLKASPDGGLPPVFIPGPIAPLAGGWLSC